MISVDAGTGNNCCARCINALAVAPVRGGSAVKCFDKMLLIDCVALCSLNSTAESVSAVMERLSRDQPAF